MMLFFLWKSIFYIYKVLTYGTQASILGASTFYLYLMIPTTPHPADLFAQGIKKIADAASECSKRIKLGGMSRNMEYWYTLPFDECMEELAPAYEKGILADDLVDILEERIQWAKRGRCDHCGDRIVTENQGYTEPDGPSYYETYCANVICPADPRDKWI